MVCVLNARLASICGPDAAIIFYMIDKIRQSPEIRNGKADDGVCWVSTKLEWFTENTYMNEQQVKAALLELFWCGFVDIRDDGNVEKYAITETGEKYTI